MNFEVVQDPQDVRLDPLRGLQGRVGGDIVVEGELAVMRALTSDMPVDLLVCTPGRVPRFQAHVSASVRCLQADKSVLKTVTGFAFHRGVLAVMPRPQGFSTPGQSEPPPGWVAKMRARGRSTTLLAQGLADPANIGAVVRCARAFAADLVIVDAKGADVFGRKAIRAAAGYTFSQPLWVSVELAAAARRLQLDLGAQVLAATPSGAVDLREVKRASHTVVMLGNEGAGLPEDLCALADQRVAIGMAEHVDSINVASAAAVLLYALT